MNIFYIRAYGVPQKYKVKQNRIFKAVEGLGYRELPVYCSKEKDLEEFDLNCRLHGSFSSFCNEAVLIMQYPSGAGFRTDRKILDMVRMYHGASLIIMKYGCEYEMIDDNSNKKDETDFLENADLVVEPYSLNGFDDELMAQKEVIDAVLAVTYKEQN